MEEQKLKFSVASMAIFSYICGNPKNQVDMTEWWNSFSSFEQVFWYIAIPFTVILFIQMILTFAGMGGTDADIGDADMDADIDSADDYDSGGNDFDMEPAFHSLQLETSLPFLLYSDGQGLQLSKTA